MKKFTLFALLFMLAGLQKKIDGKITDRMVNAVKRNSDFAVAASLSAGYLGLYAFDRWISKPTSKNLFNIANKLASSMKRAIDSVNEINMSTTQITPAALDAINRLISEISILTSTEDKHGRRPLNNLLSDKNPVNGKKRDDFITITVNKEENIEKSINVTVNTANISTLIEDFRQAARALSTEEKNRSQNAWYKRAWRYVVGAGKTTNEQK